jgi:hypothetical protein
VQSDRAALSNSFFTLILWSSVGLEKHFCYAW